jgi:hypothetical protein
MPSFYMKNFLFVIGFIALLSCNNEQAPSRPAEPTKPDTVLPNGGVGDNNVFRATGEVVVIFEPSPTRASELAEKGDAVFLNNKSIFEKRKTEYLERLKEMGRPAFVSQEDDIKLSVSEKQVYVVNAAGMNEGYGIAMTKFGVAPLVIKGLPSIEDLQKAVEDFYKK